MVPIMSIIILLGIAIMNFVLYQNGKNPFSLFACGFSVGVAFMVLMDAVIKGV